MALWDFFKDCYTTSSIRHTAGSDDVIRIPVDNRARQTSEVFRTSEALADAYDDIFPERMTEMDFYCRLDNAEVIAEPFPYLVLENVFEQDLCERLIREMPSLDVLTRGASLESKQTLHAQPTGSLAGPACLRNFVRSAHSRIVPIFRGPSAESVCEAHSARSGRFRAAVRKLGKSASRDTAVGRARPRDHRVRRSNRRQYAGSRAGDDRARAALGPHEQAVCRTALSPS